MKIISKGNKNVECERCGCIMEYDSKDIKTKIIYVGVSTWFKHLTKPVESVYIECPQCNKEIEVGRNAIQ